MKFLSLLITVILFYIFTTSQAHAYLDPGTGSLLLQGLIAAFVTIMATARLWWFKVKSIFMKTETEDTEERADEQA